MEKAHPLPKTR